MPYESTVYRILIASPSDVDEEREIASRIIQDWNDLNSYNKKIVLLPVKWETHTSPTYGIRPQESINKQIVDDCDLLIGFFWTKIGTPTGVDLGGTVEEIKRVSAAGKPVMLYFSKRGKDPSLIDITQLDALNKFKNELYKIALVENYNSVVEFRDKVSRQLEMKIRELQERNVSSKDLVAFSFINSETGKLENTSIEMNIERVEIDEQKIREIEKNDKRLEKKQWHFSRNIRHYLNKKNNIPILLGIENNLNRTLTNVLAELKVIASTENFLTIQTINSNSDNHIYNALDEFDLSKENEANIRRLFKSNLTQTSQKVWEFSSSPFILLANKSKILETVFILYPKDSLEVDFVINLFSENILEQIEMKCSLKISCTKRLLTDTEIEDIIEKLPEYDELPF